MLSNTFLGTITLLLSLSLSALAVSEQVNNNDELDWTNLGKDLSSAGLTGALVYYLTNTIKGKLDDIDNDIKLLVGQLVETEKELLRLKLTYQEGVDKKSKD